MRVLITGGAGFIGSNLCAQLYENGHSVTIMDNLSPQIHSSWEGSFNHQLLSGKCTFIKGDVCNPADWREALAGADAVVHLAAETGTGQSMYEVQRYYNVNVQGTSILLDLLVNEEHSVKKVVFASSRALYGEGKYHSKTLGVLYPETRDSALMDSGIFDLLSPDTGEVMELCATDEDSKLHPSSIYGLTKLAQEQMLLLMCRQLAISCIALRFQNVYGPGQSLNNPYTGLLAVFSNRIRNGNPLDIYEDGKESRDFVYISDVVDSIVLALNDQTCTREIFNVGSGVNTPIIKVAEMMCNYFETEVPIGLSGRYRAGDIRHNFADITKITAKLGFVPKVSFETGLQNFVSWVSQQNVFADKYEQSTSEARAKGMMK